MLKNYLLTAVRNLSKNKFFTAINIFGMTIGISCLFMIGLFVNDELSFDNYYKDKERTFRIYNHRISDNGNQTNIPIVPPTFASSLKDNYPQIESTLRFFQFYGEATVKVQDKSFREIKGGFAENSIFDMLDLNLLDGNMANALLEPNTVIISNELAKKYYNKIDVVGNFLEIGETNYLITGVYQSLPIHCHLDLDLIISFPTLVNIVPEGRMQNWTWQNFFTYIKIVEGADPSDLENSLPQFADKFALPYTKEDGYKYVPHLQNISDIYLNSSDFEWELAKRGNKYTLFALLASGIIIMIIVCVNFINLSVARSLNRISEVGIRKVFGARSSDLIIQFLGESIILSFAAMIAAGFITEMSLNFLNDFTGKSISLNLLDNPSFLFFGLVTSIILGLCSGIYPAYIVSSQPIFLSISRGKGGKKSKSSLKGIMVAVQFSLSIVLITSVLVVQKQMNFFQEKNLGFNKEQLIVLPLTEEIDNNKEAIKAQWESHPTVQTVSFCNGLPGQVISTSTIYDENNNRILASHILVDFDYIKSLGLEIKHGRDFNRNFVSDPLEGYIINETGARKLGFSNPEQAIGEVLKWEVWNHEDSVKTGKIIGVVADFHITSLREEISTYVLHFHEPFYNSIAIKIDDTNVSETISFLKKSWRNIDHSQPFSYEFLDESFSKMYAYEQQFAGLLSIFTGLAILIASLGLYGLVYYITLQKYKEIGIRKVLGAHVRDIVFLVNKQFIFLFIISLVFTIPISYLISTQWLKRFAYRIDLGFEIFLYSSMIMSLLALLIISIQSLNAASTNPVDSIKE